MRGLIRLASWGAAATAALLLAVFATRSEPGARRMAAVFGTPAPQAARVQPDAAAARTAELEFETRQMSATLRSLSADRDRLLARVTTLERNLDDVTGSISRSAARPAAQPQPQPEAPRPQTVSPSEPVSKPEAKAEARSEAKSEANPDSKSDDPAVSAVAVGPSLVATMSSPINIPTPSPETLARVGLSSIPTADDDNIAKRTDFGVDIGNGPTVASLRVAWTAIRRSHGELFEGLHPVIAVRDGARSGTIELRLVVGPLSNAAAAARLCGRVANSGLSCQPVVFDGQRLALR